MTAHYFVEVFHSGADQRVAELEQAILHQITALGVHRSVQVALIDSHRHDGPTVGVYLGSADAVVDAALHRRLTEAICHGMVVVPIVQSLAAFSATVPSILSRLNGWEWAGQRPEDRLARRLLEELGIEDRRRRVFISHKRDDGLAAAQQVHEFLTHSGFEPFVDRFGVTPGTDVQDRIADALEECAFLLLLETPLAHTSDWVYDEVEYALSHQMGMHIVTWPGVVQELPATNRLPRQVLSPDHLRPVRGYQVFTDTALDLILEEVEAVHANALARRRRYLLCSVEDAAQAAGLKCTPLPDWRLLVEASSGPSIIQVSTRLPTVDDLYDLDDFKSSAGYENPPGVLVHSARVVQTRRRRILRWASGTRRLTLIPENAVGAYWS